MSEKGVGASPAGEVVDVVRLPRQSDLPLVVTDAERDRAAAILLGDDHGAAVLANIRAQAMVPKRSAIRAAKLYAEIVGWTGTKSQVLAWLVAQLGVSMLSAQTAIRQVQRAPRDPHEIARTCRDYLSWYEGPNGPGRATDEPPV